MSVPVQTPYKKYTAAPAATVFPTTFRVVLAGDLKVTVDGVVVTSGFTLSTLGQPSGVDVTFTAPMVGGEVVELQRIIPKSRVNDYQQLGNFDSTVVNADIDRLWMSNQELGEEVGRAVKVPIGSDIDPDQLIADLLAVEEAAAQSAIDAEADRVAAQAAAAAAAASAGTVNLPSVVGKLLNFLRVKSDESGYEHRTPAQVRSDIGAAKAGADDTITSLSGVTSINGVTVNGEVLHVQEVWASGVDAGASGAGSQVRMFTTVALNTITGASLNVATGEATVPAGTYRIFARAPAFASNEHRARLVNVTDAVNAILGSAEYNGAAGAAQTNSVINGATLTIAATKVFNLTHFTAAAKAGNGLGVSPGDGLTAVYAELLFWKVA